MRSVHPEFRQGAVAMLEVAPGIAAWGVMTGVAMIGAGLGPGPSILMAVVVFAGSSQLAALPLFAAGAPAWLVLATAFCVNLRFLVFSAHLRGYVTHQPVWRRLLNGYLFADLSYVMFTRRFPTPADDDAGRAAQDAYWRGSGWTGWAVWTVSGLVGIALGSSVPASWGLGFAGTLALVAITCSLVSNLPRLMAAAVAAAVGVAAYSLPLRLNILVAIAVAVAVCLPFDARSEGPRG